MENHVSKRWPPRPTCVAALWAGLAVLAVSLVTGCSEGANPTSTGTGNRFVQGDDGIATVHAQEERPKAPSLKGSRLGGGSLTLSDYRGKVVVINIWGSWCSPCRAEVPNLLKVAGDLKDEVQFLGINTRDISQAPALAFEGNFKVNYPSWYDPIGKKILQFPKGSLNPKLIPSTIVLDKKGRIAARALKAVTEEDLRKMINPLLKEH
ncbi:TlpA family protein disulfide reductase [Streptomyces sp. 4503]|uniref:TlpA family protein disulfide reductase n=1 Tax=Streptomyces niphimycinicus TaxID=2842201 RepID=A0ABS6CP82_9ACTN|nr:TlpA disulfide reductase family protein [Streptomyces niphimycinicus]MBU3868715.1 TlpA family protein disulfide reductase [Streptomyces niphimycinicus]